ncbi:hypothetical protein ACGFNP_07020 [Nonomuraea sp. NPDC049269]|uniref:hypothetical protein n=1 Tax=Nonomuraea sp. NPDC049269 TaxID=3364349 RepID=UPI003718FA6D
MRFVSRIMIGVAATTMVAIGAPASANATTATPVTPVTTTSSHFYDADWGPYFSSDHKAKAEGHVTVDKKRFKFWYWKTFFVKEKVCSFDKKSHKKHCEFVVKKIKKHVWEWRFNYFYTVDSTLTTYKWWGRDKCAWETFKVVDNDGHATFNSFSNCRKHPADYSFSGKNAAHIYVDVSRGNRHEPTGFHSGWQDVYHAAA